MNSTQFEDLLNKRIDMIVLTLNNKAREYAKSDRLYNFKRAGEIQRIPPKKALLGMLMKHLVSVIDIVEDTDLPTLQIIDEKIGDSINYLILLEALLKEEYHRMIKPCLDCGECSNAEIS